MELHAPNPTGKGPAAWFTGDVFVTPIYSGQELFFSGVHLHGGPAPVRRFLPELIRLIWDRRIDPGRVFDLVLPLEEAAEGYRAMDERRAVKVLLTTD